MGAPAERRATYDDVLNAPPNVVAEVLFGVLHMSPRPAIRNARAGSRLGSRLGGPFDEARASGATEEARASGATEGWTGWVRTFEERLA